MEQIKWWQHRIIYQIYPRSFCDSNNDGIGDIKGIISKLDYIKSLGVGAIWLSPVYKSPNSDNGYDISDYRDINPEYGSLEDMKELIKEATLRDIKIIMDLVINHTSDEHEWFIKGIDSTSPYHDYYIWRPGRVKGHKELPPNNWQSHFTGDAWSKHPENGKYYLHLFTKKQPDLNYNNPRVIEEVKALMKFWLDLGIAGFRCDVINMIFKTSLANGKPRIYLIGKEHYLSQEGSHLILKQFHDEVWAPYNAYTVGETVGLDAKKAQAYTSGELTTVFQFDHTSVDQWLLPIFTIKYRPTKMVRILKKWQLALPWNTLFFENHDIPRSVSRFGDEGKFYFESATMLATIILTLRGTPFIYQGQEIGQINSHFKALEEMDDVSSINVYRILRSFHLGHRIAWKMVLGFCRDHARTPMPWSNAINGGFSNVKPWLKVNEAYQRINVKDSIDNQKSIWHYYKKLIALRNDLDLLQIGSITFKAAPKDVLHFIRLHNGRSIEIIINLGRKTRRIKPVNFSKVLTSNYDDLSGGKIELMKPYQAVIFEG